MSNNSNATNDENSTQANIETKIKKVTTQEEFVTEENKQQDPNVKVPQNQQENNN